jgi:hypothetical protein
MMAPTPAAQGGPFPVGGWSQTAVQGQGQGFTGVVGGQNVDPGLQMPQGG